MTTLTDTRTFTDRALAASADRALHAAAAMQRPHLSDDGLVVVWQADRGFFTNLAYVLAEPDDWADVLARIADVVPAGRPVSLVAVVSVPDLTRSGWQLVGHPPLMVRPAGGVGTGTPSELTIADVVDDAGLELFERTLVEGYPDPTLQPYRWGDVHDGRVLGGPTRFLVGSVDGQPVVARLPARQPLDVLVSTGLGVCLRYDLASPHTAGRPLRRLNWSLPLAHGEQASPRI